MYHIWSNYRPVRVPFGGCDGVHILIDRHAVCVFGTNAWPNQTANSLLARYGARRVTTVQSTKASEIPRTEFILRNPSRRNH